MATATTLQSLNTDSDFGGVSAVDASNRRVIEYFVAGETLTPGDSVSLNLAATADSDKGLVVVKTDTGTATDTCPVGVVLRESGAGTLPTYAQGAAVPVVVRGLVYANVDGTTVAGNMLVPGATAGQLAVATASSIGPTVAVAAEADTSNFARVHVFANF